MDYRRYMQQALTLASLAAARGEVPVGALLVVQNKVVVTSANAAGWRTQPFLSQWNPAPCAPEPLCFAELAGWFTAAQTAIGEPAAPLLIFQKAGRATSGRN